MFLIQHRTRNTDYKSIFIDIYKLVFVRVTNLYPKSEKILF